MKVIIYHFNFDNFGVKIQMNLRYLRLRQKWFIFGAKIQIDFFVNFY